MASAVFAEPQTYRWSREEFHQMVDLGWFVDRNVELIDGEIIEMPVQGPAHYASIDKGSRRLEAVFGGGYWVRTQAPMNLQLPTDAEPNPDISVVEGGRDDFVTRHPHTATLMIEISDSTLRYDRQRKGPIYAAAGIADYWIVNIPDRQLEVYRNPVADAKQPHGFRYVDVKILKPADEVAPLAMPNAKIKVADLLP